MQDLVLTIDCGTQGMRALIFDPEGALLAKTEKVFDGYYSNKPGYTEAPPEMFWEVLKCVVGELKSAHADLFSRIGGMTLAAQRDIITVTDSRGRALRDFISWMDRRTLDKPLPIPDPYRTAFNLAGKKGFVESFNKGTHAHWIKVHEPKLWQQAGYCVLLSTYLISRLIGRVVDAKSNIAGHFPYDFKKKVWCGPWAIKRQIIQIEREKLCELVDSCEVMGFVTAEAAAQTGLPQGLPFVGSGTDKGCETLGVGCVTPEVASVSLGTQATVEVTSEKYYELVPFYPPFPAVDPKAYNPEITVYHGMWMVGWFIRTFAEKEQADCLARGEDIYSFLDEKLAEIPPGSAGLLLQPYWGQESFKPEAAGSIIGFSDVHTKYHIYRSVIEGLGFALREGLETIEKKSGVSVKAVGLSGGGAQSDVVAGIMADIFGRPVYRVQTSETTGLGGAMAVYTGLGRYKSLTEAGAAMVRKSAEFLPDASRAALYDALYNKVYRKAYRRYRPLYRALKGLIKSNR
ncbi:MAG: FGGY-family carbohydrate kinase [Eubacterium sp.]|nr:FGGY-family carbohydrate kinase [Eubacterium sp.]